jgi:hypothetical protein
MAEKGHTRLRAARAAARKQSPDNSRGAARGRSTAGLPGGTGIPGDSGSARTHSFDHDSSGAQEPLRCDCPLDTTSADASAARTQSQTNRRQSAESPRIHSLPPVEFDGLPLPEDVRPSFEMAALMNLCREATEIGYQLSVAYSMAVTFKKAVRAHVPLDDEDILPCLSVGVLDVLEVQIRRLDTLHDHLTRALYGPPDPAPSRL